MKNVHITKNDVSYFEAGYYVGLLLSKAYTPDEIKGLSYSSVEFRNTMLQFLWAYDERDYHDQGLERVYKLFNSLHKK